MFHCAFFNSIIDKHQHMHFFTFNTVLVNLMAQCATRFTTYTRYMYCCHNTGTDLQNSKILVLNF